MSETWGTKSLSFLYDESGVYGFIYNNGTTSEIYYYGKNLQGDVIDLYDDEMERIAYYEYDAWGNLNAIYANNGSILTAQTHSTHSAVVNPLRYRSYYYDTETSLYFLNSRYYDAKIGRFINCDGYISTGIGLTGYNMYSYCNNNPIMFSDPNGNCPGTIYHMRRAAAGLESCDVPHNARDILNARKKLYAYSADAEWKHFINSDGTVSLYDSLRKNPDRVFREQIFVIDSSSTIISNEDDHAELLLGKIGGTIYTGGWEFDNVNAITTDEYSLTVVADGIGTFFVDALQLEIDNGFTPSAYNILENSGFENGMSSWIKSTETDSISVLNNSKFGTKSLAVAGSYGTEYSIKQTVSIDCMPANSYIVSSWAKGEAAATNNGEKRFDLFATVNYDYLDDSGVLRASSHTTYIPFTWETREWQYVSGVVQIPDSTENKTITNVRSIDVGVLYNNCNNVQFDNIALVQDSALRISYDDGGNISSVSIDNEDSYTYEYDDNDNLTKIFDEKGELYREYFYDTEDRLITAKDGAGTTVESYTYTNNRLVSSTVDGTSNTYGYTAWGVQNSQSVSLAVDNVMKTVSSCATYDPVTKKVTSETDSLDNTVSYGYTAEMWLSMIDDANGNRTVYEYDGEDLTDQFVDSDKDGICDEGEAVVSFTYDTFGKATGITTATTEYGFTYNTANLPVSVYVVGEETPLVTYLYNDTCTINTGYAYANGLTVCYEYDDIGNIAKILKNGEIIYTYEYDANLQVVREKDLEINATIEYFYTDSGELYFTRKTCGDDIIEFYSITDSETGKTDYITSINGVSVTYSSIYDEENDISKYILPSLDEITSDTDEFGRTDHVYLKDSEGNVILTCTYGYVDKVVGSETRTSEYIASMSYTNGTSFIYTYAPNGNILSVSDGTNMTGYFYDELDQLVRENNQQAGKTWTYTYDKAGNILSKCEYPYSVGDLGEAADTVTYTYSTGNWGDQLVNYDGTAITYDVQGNPLNWTYDRSFTWSGRQLESITCEDSVTDFTYDANGLRVGKSVYFYDELYEATEYLLEDDRIIREVYTVEGESVVSYYYYDENGMPVAWNYDGDMYYYVKNQQGDIVEIVNESGVTKVTYTYDAWGNTISHTGNAVLFNMNPFRYRGYYYDIDSGLYYLQSRYYDPEVGRFLNADSSDYLGASGTVLGYNLYAYCENNPVNNSDPYGAWKMPLSAVKNILIVFSINPLPAVLIGIGLFKLKVLLTAKFTLFISRLGTFFGPIVKVALTAVAAVTGICILGPIAVSIFDAIVQKKKGIEITLKKTWRGIPYGINVGVY